MRCRLLPLLPALLVSVSVGHSAEIGMNRLGEQGSRLCGRCADSDWLIDNGRFEVVIGATHRRDESFYRFPTADALGSIVFARARGASVRGDVMLGTPYLRLDNTTRHIAYDEVDVEETDGSAVVVARGGWQGADGLKLRFEGRYEIAADSDRIDVMLTATNEGPEPIENLIWSVFFDPHQMYDFSPADAARHRALTFRGYPRATHLAVWIDPTRRVPTSSDNEWGWDGGMILADPVPVSLLPGEAETRSFALVVAGDPQRGLQQVFRLLDVASKPVTFDFESDSDDYIELVLRDATSPAIFYRSFLDRPAPVMLELPTGSYVAEANFFPGIARCAFEVRLQSVSCRLRDPAGRRVSVQIVDSTGERVPGKVTFAGVDETPSPYFRPVNPSYGEGYWESAKNSVFPVKSTLELDLPPGAYRISASRGPAYTVDEQLVTVVEGDPELLTFTIDRVIDRQDLVSIDAHLHTLESDGAVSIKEKIRAIVAEGVDVAIATEHNFPVDYRPALEKLGLTGELMFAPGAEVTVPERLDYNTYPMTVRPGERNHGAIDSLSADLSALFEASRARDPNVILQVNHPRSWQFDYFNWHALDPASAACAKEGLDLSFDVLEVVNGAVYDTANNRATRRDWFNLMRRGHFFPLVGNSDSHEIDRDEPGYSRTWVYHGEASRADVSIEGLMQRVRTGRSFASNGPILDLQVGGRGPGELYTPGSSTVPVTVEVRSAPWIELDKVRLYVDGEPRDLRHSSISETPMRHLRAALELQLDADAFVVAEVTGTKDLSPVVQRRGGDAVTPYALTNPVFVDVDGNGRYDPPLSSDIPSCAAR